ncbi:alpha/beta hydrolase [Nocardia bovistercoris]|uniref:Esterase family protein n=1 Tax=Nocardia bovistercoris TaxID=2785916 RepID=A0A931IE28_9NOCA|nr:alpha/beta hydrolase family protein [Nocardia bovistercoris]MBH0778412.1 esterase family protein [Nocardia bovistercoris]
MAIAERTLRGPAARLVAAVLLSCALASAGANAEPPNEPTRVLNRTEGPGRQVELTVHSAAMARAVTVRVLPAANPDAPAPTLYLLNGVDGGADGNWFNRTDIGEFFGPRQVNVVVPFGGAGSWFTDWRADDPALGRQRWTTFLTRELPPLVDATFRGNGHNAIAGISMGATAVFQAALAAPGLFRAVGSFSGCASVSDPLGRTVVSGIITGHGGDPNNMWGGPDNPLWAANDPALHADKLRGLSLFVSASTGSPGNHDTLDDPRIGGDPLTLADRVVVGGAIETISADCTRRLRDRLVELRVPATVTVREGGTHAWPYWQDDLHAAWTQFEPVLAAP